MTFGGLGIESIWASIFSTDKYQVLIGGMANHYQTKGQLINGYPIKAPKSCVQTVHFGTALIEKG